MYRRNRQPEEAIRAFERAIEIAPKHEIARFNRGIVLIHDLSKLDEGIQSWKDLVDINPMARAPNGQTVDELIRQLEAQKQKQ